jgi:hypothetical protein
LRSGPAENGCCMRVNENGPRGGLSDPAEILSVIEQTGTP